MQAILSLLLGACLAAAQSLPPRQPHQPTGNGDELLTYNASTSGRAFRPSTVFVDWVSTKEDGQHIYANEQGALVLENLVTEQVETFVDAGQVPEGYQEYWIKPDLTKVLWAVNYTKQYRHSYFADYLILDRESGNVEPLVADQQGDIQYAAWSPTDDTIAFVRGNNLFIRKNGQVTQITTDGGPDTFNGVPDWVYEEEIFGDRYALWFSPDGASLAYLRFDETGVPTYTVPYYKKPLPSAPPYPIELDLRYPKVGETNPTVSFHLVDVESLTDSAVDTDAFPKEELIIGEVKWVTDEHEHVIFRAFNRVQDQEKLVLVNVQAGSSSVVRERDGTDGWLDNLMAITYASNAASNSTAGNSTRSYSNGTSGYYFDLSDESGYTHIYMHPVKGGEAVALTSGEWEVTEILKVDTERKLIHYASTEHHSTERHLYSVSYDTGEKTALVDDTVPAYWSASFSSGGGYYVLWYRGPDVPYQELYSLNSSTPIRVLSSNQAVWDRIQGYNLPEITYKELQHPDGFTLNVMQRLPANFSPDKKYPVLFDPYGGPGSQQVSKAFQPISWRTYIGSDPELEYIVYTVDNRGTGYKGRAFRAAVTKQLGSLEADDQIWAARELAKEPFVDAGKMGMWGWSYGGYLTAKVIEQDTGVFSLGVITAPVSDWRFYDSMYTERYMKTPATNAAGYDASAVVKAAGFSKIAGGFLIQHGTGDDNVHFQNAAVLVDTLVGAGVSPEKMEVQWFTDSDHSINHNGATTFLYKQLTMKLFEEKQRDGEAERHQWSRKDLEGKARAKRAARSGGVSGRQTIKAH